MGLIQDRMKTVLQYLTCWSSLGDCEVPAGDLGLEANRGSGGEVISGGNVVQCFTLRFNMWTPAHYCPGRMIMFA